MVNLKGKKVLVTGASGGIGKAIAIELSSNGADLCLTGRNKSELESLQKLIGGNCQIIISDLSKSEGIDELANGTSLPLLNLPRRGPSTIAPANAAAPPAACTRVEPAKSEKPAADNQPPPHCQPISMG